MSVITGDEHSASNDTYLADVLLLCVECHEPIRARINTPNWLRVEWIGPSGECLACHQKAKERQREEDRSPANQQSA